MSRLAAGLSLGLCLTTAAPAQTNIETLATTVAEVEDRLGARVGVTLVETGSDMSWSHRANERFLMNSTVKTPICAAMLAQLSDTLRVDQGEIHSYAPVTETRVGTEMTLAELCLAALNMSDNTATNMEIDHIGGPQAVTAFFRKAGDEVSRLDRREPELNTFALDDPRSMTTPRAMTETLRRVLLGDVLTPTSRTQLAEWMSFGGVTQDLLRADAPEGWLILDKSGGGSPTRNIIALVTPNDAEPWIATIFISDVDADFATRIAALQEIGSAAMAVIGN